MRQGQKTYFIQARSASGNISSIKTHVFLMDFMQPLSASQIKKNLNTSLIGSEILVFDKIDSTNNRIRSYFDRKEGIVIIADSQTKGKGRFGRSWLSSKGVGIYLSTLLKPQAPPQQLSPITLMAGVASVLALDGFSKIKPTLKWPNDILINGRKLGGLLCECCLSSDDSKGLIIGIGINVNHTEFPGALAQTATSLRMENGAPVDRVALIRSLIAHLDREYASFILEGPLPVVRKWSDCTTMFGKTVTLTRGGTVIRGTATQLDEQGRLGVLTEKNEEVFFCGGEVTLFE
ncbi:MAG: biotin--[acetyl-CoA-carboxylase] ligase [Nitrospinales bacterium]